MSRSRVYSAGSVVAEDGDLPTMLGYLDEPDTALWFDLCRPSDAELLSVVRRLGIHDLAVEDACTSGERSKLEQYADHLVLTLYAAGIDPETRELELYELTAFVGDRWLVTIRKDPRFPIDAVLKRWDSEPQLAKHDVGFLLWGLLDAVADSHYAVVGSLEDAVDEIEDLLFADQPGGRGVQRRTFESRKALTEIRRAAMPMRDITATLITRNPGPSSIVDDTLRPYYQDVHDHAVRAVEWADSLRDVAATIIDTDATLRGDRLNDIMKKLTSWAAILAVPTVVSGFYGMNTELFPAAGSAVGFWLAVGIMVSSSVALYVVFRRRDWL